MVIRSPSVRVAADDPLAVDQGAVGRAEVVQLDVLSPALVDDAHLGVLARGADVGELDVGVAAAADRRRSRPSGISRSPLDQVRCLGAQRYGGARRLGDLAGDDSAADPEGAGRQVVSPRRTSPRPGRRTTSPARPRPRRPSTPSSLRSGSSYSPQPLGVGGPELDDVGVRDEHPAGRDDGLLVLGLAGQRGRHLDRFDPAAEGLGERALDEALRGVARTAARRPPRLPSLVGVIVSRLSRAAPLLTLPRTLGRVAEWQTRTVQVRVSVRTWGFNSPLAHSAKSAVAGL